MKKFISFVFVLTFVLNASLANAQTISDSSLIKILQSLLKVNMIPVANVSTAKSMIGNYSAYDDTYCYSFSRDLTVGSSGDDVAMLQNFLQSKGHLGTIGEDKGYFGALTQKALASYQATNGISPANGYFGPMTRVSITSGCTSEFATSTEPMLNVELINNDVYVSDNKADFSTAFNLTALNRDIEIDKDIYFVDTDMERNFDYGLNLVLEKDGEVVPKSDYEISTNIESTSGDGSIIYEGKTVRVNLGLWLKDVKRTGNYRVSIVGFAYKGDLSTKPKMHVIDRGIYNTPWVYLTGSSNEFIKVTLPEEGNVYDGGPSQKIITKWGKFDGDFDYYRVSLSNGVVGNDPVLKSRINKKTNEYTINSQKFQEIMKKNWKRTDLRSYFIVEAIKKVKGKEKVVSSGMSGMFEIKEQNKNSDLISVKVVSKGEIFEGDKRWDMQDIILSSSNNKVRGWNIVATCPSNIGELSMKGGGACGENYFIPSRTNNITIPIGFERLDISYANINLKIEAYEGFFDKNGSFVKGKKVGETTYDLGLYAG